MKNNPFVGSGVALVTPFNEDFSVDYKSLENIVEFTLSRNLLRRIFLDVFCFLKYR